MAIDRTQAEDFIYREVRLLDRGEFRAWQTLLTDDAEYWVPSGDPSASPLENCSVIYADPRAVEDRLARAESNFYWVGQPPMSTVHAVSNVLVEPTVGEADAPVECVQVIFLYRVGDQRRDQPLHALPARVEYRLREVAGQWRMAGKKVVLLQADGLLPLLPPII